MASIIKVCRVCGKEYESCHSVNRDANVFRWQDVACSPECGATYLDRVNESRGIANVQKRSKRKGETISHQPAVEPAIETDIIALAEEQAIEAFAKEEPVENAEDK